MRPYGQTFSNARFWGLFRTRIIDLNPIKANGIYYIQWLIFIYTMWNIYIRLLIYNDISSKVFMFYIW